MTPQICWSGVTKPDKDAAVLDTFGRAVHDLRSVMNGARGLPYFVGNVPGCWNGFDTAYGWNWTFYDRAPQPVLDELRPDSPLYPTPIAEFNAAGESG